MISLEKIEETIIEMESQRDTTFATVAKLADLYIVRNQLRGYVTGGRDPIDAQGNSTFLKTVNGKNTEGVWKIIDELVSTVKVLHPKIYDSVMGKLNDL